MTPRDLIAAFDVIADAPDGVKRLRELVLSLAVRGKLVAQDPADEPASALLVRTSSRAGDEHDGLPLGWTWSTVEGVGEVKLGRQRSPKDHVGEHMVPYLRVANVQDGYLDLTDVKEMNFTPDEQEVFRLAIGDVLLNEGQSRELVGRPAIFKGEISDCCFQNTLLRFRAGPNVKPEFALIVFRSYLYSGRFQAAATQTTNIAHLSVSRLKPIPFPLPPLAEQRRIVARVDELMGLLDQFEAAHAAACALHAQFAAAAVHHLDV